MQPPKPRVRIRPNLTSFQITDEQKQTIDQAFDLFKNSSEQQVNKGQFIEGLCLDFMRRNSAPPVEEDQFDQEY